MYFFLWLFIHSTLNLSITNMKRKLEVLYQIKKKVFYEMSAFQLFILDEHYIFRDENVNIERNSKMVV